MWKNISLEPFREEKAVTVHENLVIVIQTLQSSNRLVTVSCEE
jgi:hypothetical protein